MGIVNALLTGGILVGKICQALSPGFSNKFVHDESGITLSGEVDAGGVSFYRKDVGGQSLIHAANIDKYSHATVVVPNNPNNEGGDGLVYVIPPFSSIPFPEAESPNVSPRVNVTTGLTNSESGTAGATVNKFSLLKLAFSGLTFGKTVSIGSFRLRATTSQLIILSTGITINSLAYMWLNSDKGVSATTQDQIKPDASTGTSPSETEQSFPVDFAKLGFDINNDQISGQINFEVGASDVVKLYELSKVKAQPLDAAEVAYFSRKK